MEKSKNDPTASRCKDSSDTRFGASPIFKAGGSAVRTRVLPQVPRIKRGFLIFFT